MPNDKQKNGYKMPTGEKRGRNASTKSSWDRGVEHADSGVDDVVSSGEEKFSDDEEPLEDEYD